MSMEKESLKMTEREFSKAEIDAMDELMAVGIHWPVLRVVGGSSPYHRHAG